ncbi:MAG: DUF2007 domain-containing protein [Bacteroidales bacterium]
MKKILTFNNQFEALKAKELLESKGIPHIIRSYHDSVYDGLYQTHLGWGALFADEENEKSILNILSNFV